MADDEEALKQEAARKLAAEAAAKGMWSATRVKNGRRIDDAQAVIPFVAGAFRHPSRNGYHISLPSLEYTTPVVDMKEGTWTFHVLESLDLMKQIMIKTDKRLCDTLIPVKRTIDKVEKQVTPFGQILERIAKIETKILENLESNRTSIIQNHVNLRTVIISCMAGELRPKIVTPGIIDVHTETTKKAKQSIRNAIKNEADSESKAFEKLNIKGNPGDDSALFSGIAYVDVMTKRFSTEETCSIHPELSKLILNQETEKFEIIKFGINSYKSIYLDIMTAVDAPNFLTALKTSLSTGVDTMTHYATNKQLACIDRYLAYLLAERVEILYCHVYTYFAAIIGKNFTEVSKLSRDFVESALLYSFLPALESDHSDTKLLAKFYATDPPKHDAASATIHELNRSTKDFFKYKMDQIFSIGSIDNMNGIATIEKKVKDSMFTTKAGASKVADHVHFNALFFEDTLKAVKSEFTQLNSTRAEMKAKIGPFKNKARFLQPMRAVIEPLNDVLFEQIQKSVCPGGSKYRFPYNILSKLIVYDQRCNPDFAANHMRREGNVIDEHAVKFFFYHSNSIYHHFSKAYDGTTAKASVTTIALNTPVLTDSNRVPVADPFATHWKKNTDPSSIPVQDKTTAYEDIHDFVLENIDVILPLTKKPTGAAGGGKGKQGNKGRNKNKSGGQQQQGGSQQRQQNGGQQRQQNGGQQRPQSGGQQRPQSGGQPPQKGGGSGQGQRPNNQGGGRPPRGPYAAKWTVPGSAAALGRPR